MYKILAKILILLLFTLGFAQAANIKVITKYGKTGGIKGRLNSIGDKVNGRDICPSNPTAGCDFSADPEWSDNGTPNDGSDDIYTGDLVVRTNDVFEIVAAWSWNGEVDAGEDTITLKSTLPQGYAWEDLPGACDSTLSSINGQDMVCVRKDVDKNKVGTVAEDLPFGVRVLGSVANGTQPGDISFEISAKNAQTQDDSAGVSLTVTAAPRWNLQKSYYWYKSGYEFEGEKGYRVYYKYYVEVDEVNGEEDDAPGFLGVESMGKDATFTFTDDLSEVSPNAKLIECKADLWSNSNDPYPYFNGDYPQRSVATPRGTQEITCLQNGNKISVSLKHVDATLEHIPTQAQNGSYLPVNRAIAAIGVIEVFVPLDDVKKGKDGVEGTSDDGSLPTKNILTDFDPTAPSGNSNFGNDSESELDNSYGLTLYYAKGGFSKGYAVEHGQWIYTEGGSSGWRAGNGLLSKGAEFATRLAYYNIGGIDLTGGMMCDVIDANRMTIEEIPANEARYSGVGGFDIYANGGFNTDDLEFEYASTYVDDSWLASKGGDLDSQHGDEVVAECSATTGWYSTMDEAKAHGLGVITKVRIKVKDGKALQPGQNIYAWIKHKVREKTLDGTPLQNGDELINYGSIKDNEYFDSWYKPSYIPHAYPTPPEYWNGDRVTYSGGKVRIVKSVDKSSVEPGNIVTFTLDSSFTNDIGSAEQASVTIKDMLPKGLKYISGSTQNAAEPTIGTCADVSELGVSCSSDNQVLIWNLGEKTSNEEIADIIYQAQVEITAPQGVMTNYAIISSEIDASEASQRESDVNINVTIPATINLSKNVTYTQPQETNGDPIGYEVNARNGSSVTVNNLDIIDILPFNGDGDEGAIKFRDLALKRNPGSSFHGNRAFDTMELIAHPNSPALCDLSPGIKYYYTKEAPKNVNMSPKDTSNALNTADSIWCEGDKNAPAATCGFTKADVTAVRAVGASMEEDAVCQLKITMDVSANQPDDFYNNSAGASGDEVTLPVLSNAATTVIVKSKVGDFIWFDANANGIQDAGEAGLNDINVSLYKADGTLVATTKTADDENGNSGYYYFDNLHSGDYYIQITPPLNFHISTKDAGGDDEKDSDIDASGKTETFTLGINSTDLRFDAGLYKTSSVGDTIWYDLNRNGLQDNGEDCRGMNLEVSLLSGGTEIARQTTQNCHYLFENLNQGTYQIKVTLPAGYKATAKGDGTNKLLDSDIDTATLMSDDIVLVNGIDVLDIDVGFYTETSIGDLVWLDKNANGIQDATEEGIDGINVTLLKEDGSVVAQQTTANGGKYLFENLSAGKYKVKFDVDSTYKVSVKDSGNDDALDSDVDQTTFTTDSIDLAAGVKNMTVDLGLYQEVSLGDSIWVDDDGDGIQDPNEACDNLQIKVTLLEQNISVTTQNCHYAFNHLTPGEYTLRFEIPQGYSITKKDVGDDTKDSDIDTDGKTATVVLTSSQNRTDLDAGFVQDATLSDRIWLDENLNGIQDAGEKGVADINITLLHEDGTPAGKSTQSDANGMYRFEGLVPGKYKIKITLPAGYQVTAQNRGDDESKDSDIDPNTLVSDTVTLHSGENYTNLDGGIYSIASIGDRVWLDTNADGIQDADEGGVAGVEVELLNADKTTTGKKVLTDENGYYRFENLTPKTYRVRFTLPQTYHLSPSNRGGDDTKDSDVDATLVTDEIVLGVNTHIDSVDMGLYQLAAIGDTLWVDTNNNGIQDNGESCENIAIEVVLIDEEDHESKQTTVNCHYKFENLKPGSYKIKAILPGGYTPAHKNSGQNREVDSDVNMDSFTDTIVLTSAQNNTAVDIGMVKDGSLGDRVWLDDNKNGIQDEDEKGVAGVEVILLHADGSETGLKAQTNADGIYSFTGLKPDTYKVKVRLPQGYHVTQKNSGNDEGLDSDVDPASGVSDAFALLSGMSEPRVDIGLYTDAKLGDRVWLDTNANGVQDEGEEGLAGIGVILLDEAKQVYRKKIVTDENGYYSFDSLAAGKYYVQVEVPQEYTLSVQNSTEEAKDSDINVKTALSDLVEITTDTQNVNVDIGLFQKASIGDNIWLDANENGIQDENGCAGIDIDVVLLSRDDTTVQRVKTDNCRYRFDDVVPGSYKVRFEFADNITVTKQNAAQEDKDSDIDANGISDLFTVVSAEHKTDLDAGFVQNGAIGDFIWLDANINGIQDAGEKGVENIEVILLDAEKAPLGITTKTDEKGHYSFDNLKPGNYFVKIALPEGYVVSQKYVQEDETKDSNIDPASFTSDLITIKSGENDHSIDAGIYALAKLGDTVWLDRDADGIQDESEEGIAGITVKLLHEDGTLYQTTKSDSSGKYQFANLKPVRYKVAVEVPKGYVLSPKHTGEDRAKDSDISADTNTTDKISMQSGESDSSIDIGLIALKDISGSVTVDINSDKKGERGLKDVKLRLSRCQETTPLRTVHTDETGRYNFKGLIPGCYIVTEVDPEGYTSVTDVDGVNDNNITVVLSDKDIAGRDFIDEPLLKVSGHVRADMDFDGDIEVESSKDINLKDVTVMLYRAEEKIQTVKTDENGYYEFSDVTPGRYTIKEIDPKGFDSLRDIDGKNDNKIAITVVDKDIQNRDFDDQKTIMIAGTIKVDIDGDRIVDRPLQNGQLLLCLEGSECTLESNIATTYTDNNGTYKFEGLKPGNYMIVEVDQPGYESLKDVDGGNANVIKIVLDGERDVLDQDFEDLAIAPHFVVIHKSVAKKTTHVGEFVSYSIDVENVDNAFTYAALKIKDILPGGFKYEKNSARLIRGNSKVRLQATGKNVVEFGPFVLHPKEKVTVTYLLKVGVGAAHGNHVNKAVAVSNDEEVSNLSKATVKVKADPFIDNAVVIGKVFADENGNGMQDAGEEGIPGVRLATVTGLIIETDGYGRYHVPDVESGGFGGRGKNFILKVDSASLPKGATFTTENPRVYRVTAGGLNRIDFGVRLPKTKKPMRTRSVKKVVVKNETVEVPTEIKIGSIYFDSDQDCIRPDQVEKLKEIAQKLKAYGHGAVVIEGNTDARAPMWYNKKLAYKRARSVFIELKHLLGEEKMKDVEVVYNNCNKEVKFNPLYDWWGKPNAPKTKKECTKFGILQKDCNRLIAQTKGGAK